MAKSPDIPFLKKNQKNWQTINSSNSVSGMKDKQFSDALENAQSDVLHFALIRLREITVRDDYREF